MTCSNEECNKTVASYSLHTPQECLEVGLDFCTDDDSAELQVAYSWVRHHWIASLPFKLVFFNHAFMFTFLQVANLIGGTCARPCDSNPCLNGGRCLNIDDDSFQCVCDDPYRGDRCQDRKFIEHNSCYDVSSML